MRKKRKRSGQLRGSEVDHRELFKLHMSEASKKLSEVERAARDGNCHKALQYLVGAGAEHGLAKAHADQLRDGAMHDRSNALAGRLNLLVDTIGFQCTRPRRK